MSPFYYMKKQDTDIINATIYTEKKGLKEIQKASLVILSYFSTTC